MIPRYNAISRILSIIPTDEVLITTTGMISREVFDIHDRPNNFYMLGSMGLLSSFGLGLALKFPTKKIWILEGDGSALMSLGTIPLIASEGPENLVHFILDNESYESTGGQPSISSNVSLEEIARSSGYPSVNKVTNIESLELAISEIGSSMGPILNLVKCGTGPVAGIPRVTLTPEEIRNRFKSALTNQ
ncbi:MAG: thiamine pyrophosphate-dependent enzyme [Chloroflexota bacterium]|nr:thiamine pyrophosphate-dependent enzyme [Chloroflexota bacterium]|tara:strand:+ start:783 stop:1352 length:570 start_codon:yes stop_codon:yes gene_type:complete